jgi:hypothetical protein
MRSFRAKRSRRPGKRSMRLLMAGGIGVCLGSTAVAPSQAQQLLPADRQEITDQERLSSWTLSKFPPQPYMNEVYWQYPRTPRRSSAIPWCSSWREPTT